MPLRMLAILALVMFAGLIAVLPRLYPGVRNLRERELRRGPSGNRERKNAVNSSEGR